MRHAWNATGNRKSCVIFQDIRSDIWISVYPYIWICISVYPYIWISVHTYLRQKPLVKIERYNCPQSIFQNLSKMKTISIILHFLSSTQNLSQKFLNFSFQMEFIFKFCFYRISQQIAFEVLQNVNSIQEAPSALLLLVVFDKFLKEVNHLIGKSSVIIWELYRNWKFQPFKLKF